MCRKISALRGLVRRRNNMQEMAFVVLCACSFVSCNREARTLVQSQLLFAGFLLFRHESNVGKAGGMDPIKNVFYLAIVHA